MIIYPNTKDEYVDSLRGVSHCFQATLTSIDDKYHRYHRPRIKSTNKLTCVLKLKFHYLCG